MHTAEPFVPEPSDSKIEIAIGKMKRYISPGVEQIRAELIRARWETLRLGNHKFIKLLKEEFPHQGRVNCGTYSRKGR
jgi:hypothetical protein